MTITAYSGPVVVFGTVVGTSGNSGEYNEDRAVSMYDLGTGLLDPRTPYAYLPGQTSSGSVVGFYNNTGLVDGIAATKSTQLLATSSQTVPVANTAITLNTSMAASGFTPNISILAPESGRTVTVSAIDWSTSATIGSSVGAFLTFGSAGRVAVWNPANAISRVLILSPSSNLDGGNFTVAGRDLYGFKMTEKFAAGATTITGKKAFKYITSIVASSTITSTGLGVGTVDTYGFPFAMQTLGGGYAEIWQNTSTNASLVTLVTSASHTIGSTVATQTSTTPDVRGTFNSTGIAANSSIRLQIFQRLSPVQLASVTSTNWSPIFGAVQFSSV